MTTDLAGRTVLLTGATGTLGEAFARALAGAGARVALVARRHDRLAALAAELPGAVDVVADLADVAALAAVVEQARAALGPIDTLVNAGARGTTTASADAPPAAVASSTSARSRARSASGVSRRPRTPPARAACTRSPASWQPNGAGTASA